MKLHSNLRTFLQCVLLIASVAVCFVAMIFVCKPISNNQILGIPVLLVISVLLTLLMRYAFEMKWRVGKGKVIYAFGIVALFVSTGVWELSIGLESGLSTIIFALPFRVFVRESKEVTLALKLLDNPCFDYGQALFLKESLKKNIQEHSKEFVSNLLRDGRGVQKHVYSMIVNGAATLIESGQFHLQRGVLNPMGPGADLMRVYDSALDELVRLGDMEPERAELEKKTLRKSLKQAG